VGGTQELDLAQRLVESLAASFEPTKYQDRYRHNLRSLIDAKIRGEELKPGTERPAPGPVPDILEALKASLARAKKPAMIAEPSAEPKRSRKALAS
jgi:DNA end-binding protein Ku